MKRPFRKAVLVAMALLWVLGAGCGSKIPENRYERDPIVKEDSIFPMETYESANPTVERVAKRADVPDGVEAIFYTSIGYGGADETRIFAYLGKPKTEAPAGGYPGVVLVHGGLGKAEYSWVEKWTERGYAAIAMDLFANMDTEEFLKVPNPEGGPGESNVGSFLNMGLPDQTWTWTYQRVVSCILANNVLRAEADVNPDKIGLVGISWGAYLTCITAGLDHRFAFYAPIYGCGYLYEDTTWIAAGCNQSMMSEEEYARWIATCDPSSYLPYATGPMLFLGGMNADEPFACNLRQKSADLVPGKVFYSYREALVHSQESGDSQVEVMDFADHVVLGKDSVVLLSEPEEDGQQVRVTAEGTWLPVSAELVYTTADTGNQPNGHLWQFQSAEATCSGSEITATLPEGTSAYFVSVTDGNGSRWSTALHIRKD